MKIDIMNLAAVISALSIIVGGLFAVFKFYNNSKKQSDEIKNIKKEQALMVYVQRACLDGLHQLGCNGKVTEAINRLDKYINKAAHDEL